MNEKVDFLEKEYGIKESNRYYSITYVHKGTREEVTINGNITNFNGVQAFLITENGLYIILVKDITSMYPIRNKSKRQFY